MHEIILKASSRRARVLRGHPWVFAGEIEKALPADCNGLAVQLKDSRGRSLGAGIYNGKSSIIWRRFSRDPIAFEAAYLEKAIGLAVERRAEEEFRRLVWSEADDLPGLVVDQFSDVLVVQALTLAVDERLEMIADILQKRFSPAEIVFRNDAPTRTFEGLERENRTRSGKEFGAREFNIDGIVYDIDLLGGQKTGFYLDQRDEHLRVASLAEGRRVLDGFCNQGAFGLQCARAGAASVTGVDSSTECIAAALENSRRNGLATEYTEDNMFDYFSERKDARNLFDLIILDPPSFARNRKALDGALRGYKELNLRALKLLAPGGILATYSCSQHVDRSIFLEMLADAAADARRNTRLLAISSQRPDHPVRLNFPESEYLKGAILAVD